MSTLELSTTDLDELPLSLLGDLDVHLANMPWFKKLWFNKKRNKRAKREISEPTSFQHCYHATVDGASGEFVGLPPQWVNVVSSPCERPPKSLSSSCESSTTALPSTGLQPSSETRTTAGACVVDSAASVVTVGSEEIERGSRVAFAVSDGEKTPGTDRSVSSSPVSAVTSRENASTRPVPIIRGSDCCLEETIKYIRKHYRSASSGSPYDEEATDEQYVDIHFRSRSRSGSLMQLRNGQGHSTAVGIPRASTRSNTMNNSSSPLSSNLAFCLSAPHDLNVVQSDLGLYDCNTSSVSNTTLFRSRIHSPSESSGYFGSTMSSLCSSRISALSSIPPIHAPSATQQNPATSPHYRYTTLHESTEAPWLHPQMRHGQPQFSSLQRPVKHHRDAGSHVTHRPYVHVNIGSNNVAAIAGSPPGHYGTTPRNYAHRPRGESVDNGLVYRYHRERSQPESRHNRTPVSNLTLSDSHTYHPCYAASVQATTNTVRNVHPVGKSKRQSKPMSSEQFRATLKLLVNKNDPRKDLCEIAKVGEGSTGVVFLARQISTGQKVAVKKMNLRRQQRRELLFNEVMVVRIVLYHVLSNPDTLGIRAIS